MSFYRIPVVPKRKVDFTNLVNGTTEDLVLAERVELVQWREVQLLVGVTDHTISGTYGTISILAIPESWSEEDPTISFLSSSSYGVTIDNTTPSPAYLNTNLLMLGSDCVGTMARIVARGSKTSAGSQSANIVVELAVTDG